jgi:RNA polymerase sigma factor (sigma-70 family)
MYHLLKGKMYTLCLRYAHTKEDAEDMLHDGFMTVFRDIHQFKYQGPIEGWVRKVILHTALQHLRKQSKNVFLHLEETHGQDYHTSEAGDADPFEQEAMIQTLLAAIQKMPTGFRTVLNLYIFENYSHDQIAQTLQISEGTSKSQLKRAKDYLKKVIAQSLNVND